MSSALRVVPLFLLLLAADGHAEPAAIGQTLEPFSLDDQHGQTRAVDAEIRAILFGRDMKAGDVLQEALGGADASFLEARRAVYVADIHRMPGLVARMIAIPRMKKRPYPMLLDRDGDATRDLPGTEGRATLISLDALRITGVRHFASPEELRAALEIEAPAEPDDR